MPSKSRPAPRTERDIRYGEGAIGYGTDKASTRPLLLDAYLPEDEAPANGRPALLLSHGGAFHRGAKDKDEFEQDGARNTPVHEYCERFAARGYACFSIGYRLTQERLPPLDRQIKRNRETMQRDRIDHIRKLLALPVATNDELINGAEGAFADVANAFRFVHANAARWGIDTGRMAIGGFSAGGYASAYSVFAFGVPAAAIICMSSGMDPEDAEYYLHAVSGKRNPPVLLFNGETDLPGVPESEEAITARAARAKLATRHYVVPGKSHFYDRESKVVLKESTMPGGENCATVEEAMQRFLTDALV